MSAKFSFSYRDLYHHAFNRLTTAAMLEMADDPVCPSDSERAKVLAELLGDESSTVYGAHMRHAYRQAPSRAIMLYVDLSVAVEECFIGTEEL